MSKARNTKVERSEHKMRGVMSKTSKRDICLRAIALIIVAVMALAFIPARSYAAGEGTATVVIETAYPGAGSVFSLYRVADLSSDGTMPLTDNFKSTGVELNADMTSEELAEATVTLRAYVDAAQPEADYTVTFDNNDSASVSGVKSGVYLVTGTSVTVNDGTRETRYDPTPYIIVVEDGETVTTEVKYTQVDNFDSEKKDYKVVKHWLNDGDGTYRPTTIKVRIMKDGEFYKDVELSEDNDWTYSWSDTEGSRWSVYEYTQVQDYTQTLKESGTTFIVSNKYTKVYNPKYPDKQNKQNNPKNPNGPKTGDPTNPMWFVICLASAGAVLLLIYVRRRGERS